MGKQPTQSNIYEYLPSHQSQDMEIEVVVSSQAKAMPLGFRHLHKLIMRYLKPL